MRRSCLLPGLLALAALASAAEDRYVVLISVDGLAAYYFDDPRAPIPTLRRLAAQGARAEGMVVTFPSATWPSHISLATGVSPSRHGVLANSVWDRAAGREIVHLGDQTLPPPGERAPAIYDAAHKAGLRTASVIWPGTAGSSALNWVIPDSDRKEILERYTTPGLAEELESAGISIRQLGKWGWSKDYSGARDLTYTRVAGYLLARHRPHLTMLHLITPDGHQHNYGPRTEEAYWALGSIDDRIRQIWETLQEPPFAGKATLLVVADHGFAEYDRLIYPNVLLKQMGLVTTDASGAVIERQAWFHAGCNGIYLLDRGDPGKLAAVKERFSRLEGIDRIVAAGEFAKHGLPEPSQNPRQADLMLSARPGYWLSGDVKGTEVMSAPGAYRGSHGHLPDQRFVHAVFLAAGAGVRPGSKLGKISSLDVAPTAAVLLGIRLPSTEGRALREILIP